MKIPTFKLNFEDDFINSFVTNAKSILEAGFVGEGKWVKEFEKRFKLIQGCSHAIATTSGTSSIEIALKALDVRSKDVIVPTNTFFATAVAVKNAGGNVVLVDCNKEDFSMCLEALESKITPNTAAVITVHIGGIISSNIYDVLRVCGLNNLPLVEDAAHAHGSKLRGIHAGSFGTLGCFSFFPTKCMTTGEGGMVTTNDEELSKKVRSLKNFGRDYEDIGICSHEQGGNAKINEFTGLLGSLECDRLQARLKKRIFGLDSGLRLARLDDAGNGAHRLDDVRRQGIATGQLDIDFPALPEPGRHHDLPLPLTPVRQHVAERFQRGFRLDDNGETRNRLVGRLFQRFQPLDGEPPLIVVELGADEKRIAGHQRFPVLGKDF